MSRVGEFYKTTFIGGLVVLLPIGVILALFARVVISLRDQLAPMMAHLPYGGTFPALLAVVIVLAVSFFTGLVVRTRAGQRISLALERGVLAKLPGYLLLKALSQRVAGETEGVLLASALVQTDAGLVPAFIVEEHADGSYTVFVPAVPTPAIGAIYIVPRERVHRLNVPLRTVVKCVAQWGTGSGELIRAMHRDERSHEP